MGVDDRTGAAPDKIFIILAPYNSALAAAAATQ
jgi:hypothetical protein